MVSSLIILLCNLLNFAHKYSRNKEKTSLENQVSVYKRDGTWFVSVSVEHFFFVCTIRTEYAIDE